MLTGAHELLKEKKLTSKSFTDNTIDEQRRQLFASVLVQEFIREILFLWDVINGRAKARDTFITQISNQLKTILGIAPGGEKILKTISLFVEGAACAAQYLEEKATAGGKSSTANLVDQSDVGQFEILLSGVAREIVRRYEHFIIKKIKNEESITLLAKVGARRMLEYLSRKGTVSKENAGICFDENVLLTGLIEGRSGGYVDGWRNHQLTLINGEKISAETVYARAGFRIFELRDGKPIDQRYTLDEKNRNTLGLGMIESGFRFGFTKFKKDTREPKAGYAVVSPAVIEKYGYALHSEQKIENKKQESKEQNNLMDDNCSYTTTRVVIDKETIKQFLIWTKLSPENNSLRTYVRQTLNSPGIESVICHEDLRNLALAHKDLSFCDFSGAQFGGDLTGTKFNSSYLVGVVFDKVTSARQAEFKNAHCEFLNAENIDFSDADFTQAHFDYARFKNCELQTQKTLGSSWSHAVLDQVKAGQWVERLQETTMQEQAHYWQVLGELHRDIRGRTQALYDAQEQLANEIKNEFKQNKKLCDEMQRGIQNLVDQQTARIVFESYCKQEIQSLKVQISKKGDKQDLEKLQSKLKGLENEVAKLKNNQDLLEELQKFKKSTHERLGNIEHNTTEFNQRLEQLEKIFLRQLTDRVEVLEQKSASQQRELDELLSYYKKIVDERKQPSTEELEKLTPLLTQALKDKYSAINYFDVPLAKRKLPLANIQFSLTTRLIVQSDTKPEQSSETKDQKKAAHKDQLQAKESQKDREVIETPITLEAIFDAEKNHELIDKANSPVDQLSLIPKKLSPEAPKSILLTADAGFGKTTLSRYIAFRWSGTQNALWVNRFDFVFLLPLRILRNYLNKSVNLPKILFDACWGNDKENSKLLIPIIDYVIKNKSERCLFVLEGADEITALLPHTDDNIRLSTAQLKLKSLLKSALPESSYVLVTSRPYQVYKIEQLLPNKKFDRQLQNRGFNNQQVEHAIDQYFAETKNGPEQSESLKKYLKANSHIQNLAQVPLHIALICAIWKKEQGHSSIDQMNMTLLYYKIISEFLRNHLEKKKPIDNYTDDDCFDDPDCKAEMQFLQQLAFETLSEGKTQFCYQEMDLVRNKIKNSDGEIKVAIINTAYQLGFLTTIEQGAEESEVQEEMNKQCEFMHLTFQEFLAARYLKESLSYPKNSARLKKVVEFIQLKKYDRHYSRLLEFTAGLVSLERATVVPLKNFWNSLLAPPQDLAMLGHWGIVIRCLEESREKGGCDTRIPQLSQLVKDFNELIIKLLNSHIDDDLLIEYLENVWELPRCPIFCKGIDLKQLWSNEAAYLKKKSMLSLLTVGNDKETFIKDLAAKLLQELSNKDVPSRWLVRNIYKDVSSRWLIINSLEMLGDTISSSNNIVMAREVIKVLLHSLQEDSFLVSESAIQAIGKMGTQAITMEVISALLGTLKETSFYFDILDIVKVLVILGDKDPVKLINILISFFKAYPKVVSNENDYGFDKTGVVLCIIEVLARFGDKVLTDEVVITLLEMISYIDRSDQVAEALVKIVNKDQSNQVLTKLIEILNSSDSLRIKLTLVTMLSELDQRTISDPSIVPPLLEMLNGNHSASKRLSACLLGKLGKTAATIEVINQLLSHIEHEDIDIRNAVIYALSELGKTRLTETIVSALLTLKEKTNTLPTVFAAFGNIGEAAANNPKVIELLMLGLKNGERAAVNALAKLGKIAAIQPLKPILIKSLRIKKVAVESAAALLELYGNDAPIDEIITVLSKRLIQEGPYSDCRHTITAMLVKFHGRIQPSQLLNLSEQEILSLSENNVIFNVLGKKSITESYVKLLLKNACNRTLIAMAQLDPKQILLFLLKNIATGFAKYFLLELNFPIFILMDVYLQTDHPYLPSLIARNMFNQVMSFTIQPDNSSANSKDKNLVTFYVNGETRQYQLTNKQVKKLVQELKKFLKELNLPTTFCDHYVSGKPVYSPADVLDGSTVIVKVKNPDKESKAEAVHPSSLVGAGTLSIFSRSEAANALVPSSSSLQTSTGPVSVPLSPQTKNIEVTLNEFCICPSK